MILHHFANIILLVNVWCLNPIPCIYTQYLHAHVHTHTHEPHHCKRVLSPHFMGECSYLLTEQLNLHTVSRGFKIIVHRCTHKVTLVASDDNVSMITHTIAGLKTNLDPCKRNQLTYVSVYLASFAASVTFSNQQDEAWEWDYTTLSRSVTSRMEPGNGTILHCHAQ